MKNKKAIIISIIVLIILAILLGIVGRKIYIIKDINNKVSKYEENTNVYVKSYSDSEEIASKYTEKYRLDDMYREKMKRRNEESYLDTFIDGNEIKMYMDSPDAKVLTKKENDGKNKNFLNLIPNYYKYENFKELLSNSIHTSIKSEKINGKDCYILSGIKNPNLLVEEGTKKIEVYVEKETGLTVMVKTYKENSVIQENYEYKFGSLTEKDLEQPDESKYEIK